MLLSVFTLIVGMVSFMLKKEFLAKLLAHQLVFISLWMLLRLVTDYRETTTTNLIIFLILNITQFWFGIFLLSSRK